VHAEGAARDLEALIETVPAAFEAMGARPARIWTSTGVQSRELRYTVAQLVRSARADDCVHIEVGSASKMPTALVNLVLRDRTDLEALAGSHRAYAIGEGVAPDAAGPAAFLEAIARAYPVVHGGAMMAPSWYAASAEASLTTVGGGLMDEATCKRIGFDAMHMRELHLLRRLYPVTIIGPAIWAKLPPMPEVDPAPAISDLGACKVLKVWPTLVDPHDPHFLLGTRALRRWLWPFTIQNPADDPDEIDHRLRWLDLLPW